MVKFPANATPAAKTRLLKPVSPLLSGKTKPNKKRQKDTDSRWATKNGTSHYGYKDHIKVDNKYKLIQAYCISDASMHDSQALKELLDATDKGQTLHADSAYTGEEHQKTIRDHQMINKVHQKGYRNHPLSEGQKKLNRYKSKTRARVEHVFGFMTGSMNQLYVRCIGSKRAKGVIGLINLTYNLFRMEQLVRMHGIGAPMA